MDSSLGDVRRLASIIVLFAALGALSVFALPSAMAAPGIPSHGGDNSIVKDSSAFLTITEADGAINTVGLEIRMFSQLAAGPVAGTVVTNNPLACDMADPGDPGILGPVWGLRLASDHSMKIGYKFTGNPIGFGDEAQIITEFGTLPGNPVSVFSSAAAEITAGGVGIVAIGVDLVDGADWVELDGTGTPIVAGLPPSTGTGTGLPRIMALVSCGEDLPIDKYAAGHSFQIVPPIGGTVLPISMTSLFIAGLSNSVIWLVPLGAAVGGALFLLKFQLSRKEL